MSWVYHRFLQWCLPERQVFMYPMALRLPLFISFSCLEFVTHYDILVIGLTHQSRDQHETSPLMAFIARSFVWTPYDDPALQAMCPPWFIDEAEWGTWLTVVPFVCFNIVEFHQVDRVKRQFNRE
ncbi:hypothetical protein Ahy_B09g097632 [Arachis hypogaea]|uniref:Aminotransferase-like plant mobile domain-containing protein n=1 Tax=Arachis hypogaea TaxID=3818 RepID=A0A444XQ24_ARAHY|nr:hypothetical protein Ahy_B09g097632 [Arachis hypogaea]